MIRVLNRQYDIIPIQADPWTAHSRDAYFQIREAIVIFSLYPACYKCNGKGMYYDGHYEAYDICYQCNGRGIPQLSHSIRFVQFLLRLSQLRIEVQIRSKFWLRILRVN